MPWLDTPDSEIYLHVSLDAQATNGGIQSLHHEATGLELSLRRCPVRLQVKRSFGSSEFLRSGHV